MHVDVTIMEDFDRFYLCSSTEFSSLQRKHDRFDISTTNRKFGFDNLAPRGHVKTYISRIQV